MAVAVAFVINILKMSDFAKASNFICKVDHRQELIAEETENICFKRITPLSESEGKKGEQLCRIFLENIKSFSPIHTPEKIRCLEPLVQIYYLLAIDANDMSEITQYQNLFLLHECYKKNSVYSLIRGNTPFYFKLSQYLSFAAQSSYLTENIFYLEEGIRKPKRLQGNNIQLSETFFPLLIVNESNIQRLKSPCYEQLGQNALSVLKHSGFSKKQELTQAVEWPELGGTMKIMADAIGKFLKISKNTLLETMRNLDTLALIFLSYLFNGLSIANSRKEIQEQELKKYAILMQEYANACHQLMENIIFHSDARQGILSIRLHQQSLTKTKKYLTETYGIDKLEDVFFEVSIRDFAGGRQTTNIVTNLQNNLPDEDKKIFSQVTPQTLFANNWENCNNPWEQLYKKPKYIGKHFGLRIFRRILQENGGVFQAESRYSHLCIEGDSYGYNAKKSKDKYGMPGTSYQILLPLKQSNIQYIRQDTYQEYGDWLNANPSSLAKLKSYLYKNTELFSDCYREQSEKDLSITHLAEHLQKQWDTKSADIFSMNADEIPDRYVEILVKAIIIFEYFLSKKCHVFFYNCSENFFKAFYTFIKFFQFNIYKP